MLSRADDHFLKRELLGISRPLDVLKMFFCGQRRSRRLLVGCLSLHPRHGSHSVPTHRAAFLTPQAIIPDELTSHVSLACYGNSFAVAMAMQAQQVEQLGKIIQP